MVAMRGAATLLTGFPDVPTPFSPVHSARKFSAVLGTVPPYSPSESLPAGSPPMDTSKNTLVVVSAIRTSERRRSLAALGESIGACSSAPWSNTAISCINLGKSASLIDLDWFLRGPRGGIENVPNEYELGVRADAGF